MKEFTRAGPGLPHDLRHFAVERELGIADGIRGGISVTGPLATMRSAVRSLA